MRSDIDHLPAVRQRELAEIQRILFDKFKDALAGKNAPRLKAGRILKVILFGSFARGDWVADPVGGYFSDFDILIVVNGEALTDFVDYWALAEDHLVREHMVTGQPVAPRWLSEDRR